MISKTNFTFISAIVVIFISTKPSITVSDSLERKYGKIIHVSTVFRHGDRSPLATYPKDPYISYPWPDGLGQLLKKGQLKSYNLGKWMRNRYSRLHKMIDSHTRIRVDSSFKERAIMSAQCFLAGFHPPKKGQRFQSKLRWQPIPIHIPSNGRENFISVEAPCPAVDNETIKFYNSVKMRKKYDAYADTFEFLRMHTGYEFSKNDFFAVKKDLLNVEDALRVETENNLTLPTWTQDVYPRLINEIFNQIHYASFSNFKIRRLSIGSLLNSIKNDLENNVNSVNRTILFHFYSGQDVTIACLMFVMGNFNDLNPPYSSAMTFELRKKVDKYYVTVNFKNSTENAPHQLHIPKCGTPCTLKRFVRMVRPHIFQDWNRECRKTK